MRALLGLAAIAIVGSSPALSQPGCNDDTVLRQVVSDYLGLSEFAGMTDAEIRDKLIAAPQTQHWRDMAKVNAVGEAIASWVFDIDIQATISAQHLVRSITAMSSSYEQDSNAYRCQATLDFDMRKPALHLSDIVRKRVHPIVGWTSRHGQQFVLDRAERSSPEAA